MDTLLAGAFAKRVEELLNDFDACYNELQNERKERDQLRAENESLRYRVRWLAGEVIDKALNPPADSEKDLPDDAKQILYDNCWKLYGDSEKEQSE
jgi:regulator of replication initiation timing